MSSDELPGGASGLSPALEEEIQSILAQRCQTMSRAGGCLRTPRPALGLRPRASAAASQELRGSSLITWVSRFASYAPMSASRSWERKSRGPSDNYEAMPSPDLHGEWAFSPWPEGCKVSSDRCLQIGQRLPELSVGAKYEAVGGMQGFTHICCIEKAVDQTLIVGTVFSPRS